MNVLSNPGFDGSEVPWQLANGTWFATGGRSTPGSVELYCNGGDLGLGIDPFSGVVWQENITVQRGKIYAPAIYTKTNQHNITIEASVLDEMVTISLGAVTLTPGDYTRQTFTGYSPSGTNLILYFVVFIGGGHTGIVRLDDAELLTVTPAGTTQYFPPENGNKHVTFHPWDKDGILGTLVRRDHVHRDNKGNVRLVTDLGRLDRDDLLSIVEPITERGFEEL